MPFNWSFRYLCWLYTCISSVCFFSSPFYQTLKKSPHPYKIFAFLCPNFEEVEAPYWFGLLRVCLCLLRFAYDQEWLDRSWNLICGISMKNKTTHFFSPFSIGLFIAELWRFFSLPLGQNEIYMWFLFHGKKKKKKKKKIKKEKKIG